jgi:hypothetical protein
MDLSNTRGHRRKAVAAQDGDLTLSDLSASLAGGAEPVDPEWLRRVTSCSRSCAT